MDINKRIKYIDMLKFLAIFAVIFLHAYKIDSTIMIGGHNFYKLRAFIDFGVPLFLMVTGALALNKDIDLRVFFKKKIVRICLPLAFYFKFSYFLGVHKNPLISFWYSWMIIGAYFAIPLVNKIIQNSTMREIEYFVAMIIVTSIFYSLSYFLNFEFSLDLNFFITPISYIVIGYYLSKRELNMSYNKLIIISLIIYVAFSIIKMKVGLLTAIYPRFNLSGVIDLGIFEIIQVSSVFLIFRCLYDNHADKFKHIRGFLERDIINRFIVSVSRSTYGMFFIHAIIFQAFLYPFVRNLHISNVKIFMIVILSAIGGLFISWILTWLLSRIPYVKYFVGYA